MEDTNKQPAVFARLTIDREPRTAEDHASLPVPLAEIPLHDRLLRLAAHRLRKGLTPPRSYYWWNDGTAPVRLETRTS